MALQPWYSAQLILGRLFRKICFAIFRLIFNIVQGLSWKFTGIKDVCTKNKELEQIGGKPVAQALKV
jgi:hypothetical protein